MAVGAVIGAIVMAGTSVAIAANSQPKSPDLGASSAALSNAQAAMLPWQRALEAAAAQGKAVTLNVPHQETVKQVFIPQTDKDGNAVAGQGAWVNYNPAEWTGSGKYAALGNKIGTLKFQNTTSTVTGPKTYDFTGYGQGDVQGAVAKAMAGIQLSLSQKYDSSFIDEALKQEQEADPQGFAARQKESELIQQQIDAKPERPVAELLDKQIGEQLQAAKSGHLDTSMRGVLDDAVGKALAARGGNGAPGADFEQPLVTGAAGTARQREAAQKATGWLSSGATPEDIAYRREQQNLSNLSAEVNGRTPQSQFASLSGAQKGPTPMVSGQPLPTLPTDQAGAQGAALQNWQTQMTAANGQVNPWLAGVTGALNISQLLAASQQPKVAA